MRFIALLFVSSLAIMSHASGRNVTSLDGNWKLRAKEEPTVGAETSAFDDHKWKTASVPSAFNAKKNDWSNLSNVWYRRHFNLSAASNQRVYLTFEAVNAVSEVYVNGRDVGGHRGGYTRFTLDITDAAKKGDNVVAVHVDNKNFKDCLPAQQRLFKIYGGIIRDVWLTTTNSIHIDPTDHGSEGVYFTPTVVTPEESEANLRVLIRNCGSTKAVRVQGTLMGGPVAYADSAAVVNLPAQGNSRTEAMLHLKLKRAQLWSPESPKCYRLNVQLSVGGKLVDAIYGIEVGFRKIERRGETLYLNDKPIILRGFAKHEDTEASGGAITHAELDYEYRKLKDVGANFVRMAHYPHSQYEVGLADTNGICVWAENGHISALPATDTGRELTREMVRQLYNHPSVILWSCGNEADKNPATANEYARVIHEEDKTRLVTYADNHQLPVSQFPQLDVVSRNAYPQWYGGGDIAKTLLRDHFVSENGFGACITTHVEVGPGAVFTHKVDKFEPEEYQCENLETVCATVFGPQLAQIPLYAMWNFRDFADRKYKGLNTKGMLTFDGMPKDCYYLWRSFFRPNDPTLHITGSRFFIRPETATTVKVYSSLPALRLLVNGEDQGIQKSGDYSHSDGLVVPHVFAWNIRLLPGSNKITATDGHGHSDSCVLTSPVPPMTSGPLDRITTTPGQPAIYVDDSIKPDFGFYQGFDGNADNTIATLPKELNGCRWISTLRLSDSKNLNDLGIHVGARSSVTLYVLTKKDSAVVPELTSVGFSLTNLQGEWRTNKIELEPYVVYQKVVPSNGSVNITGVKADYLILVKAGH